MAFKKTCSTALMLELFILISPLLRALTNYDNCIELGMFLAKLNCVILDKAVKKQLKKLSMPWLV